MKWRSTFQYLPVEYGMELASLEDRTQRVSFPNNLNGTAVRLLLSNKMGSAPLLLDGVSVGVEAGGQAAGCVPVTLEGSSRILLAPGQERLSDPAPLKTAAGERLCVSVYVRARQSIQSVCCFWSPMGARVQLNAQGDAVCGGPMDSVPLEDCYEIVRTGTEPDKGQFFFGFSAVQVLTDDGAKLIAAFGDSITHMSYLTNELISRLYGRYPGQLALVNLGIGGNRLVHGPTFIEDAPAHGRLFGPAGVERFERDVYGLDTPETVLVLEGINDIVHPVQFGESKLPTSAAALEEGFRAVAAVARKHGSRLFAGTVMPCGGYGYPEGWLPLFEESRQQLNVWLRQTPLFDAVFDYDAAVRDEAHPDCMREGLSLGDGVHPGPEAARLMADAVDLSALWLPAHRASRPCPAP